MHTVSAELSPVSYGGQAKGESWLQFRGGKTDIKEVFFTQMAKF